MQEAYERAYGVLMDLVGGQDERHHSPEERRWMLESATANLQRLVADLNVAAGQEREEAGHAA